MRRIDLSELEWQWLKWLAAEPLPIADVADLEPRHRVAINDLRELGLASLDREQVALTGRGNRAALTPSVVGPNNLRVVFDLDPEEWVGRASLFPRREPPT